MTASTTLKGIRLVRAAIALQGSLTIPNGATQIRVSSVIVQGRRWVIDGGPGRLWPVTPTGKKSLVWAAERVMARKDQIEADQKAGAAAAWLR